MMQCRFRGIGLGLALAVGLLAAGCATGQKATVTPTVVVEKEELGGWKPLAVSVTDGRKEPVIGLCNPASPFGGKLTVACDPSEAIRQAVERGLKDKGFAPSKKSEAVVRNLSITLTEMAYTPRQETTHLAAKAVITLEVAADNNGEVMKRKYTGETVWKLDPSGVEPDFDKLLSMTASKAVSRLSSDYELIAFLSKTVLRTREIK